MMTKRHSARSGIGKQFERRLRDQRAQLTSEVRSDLEESEHQSYAEVVGEVRDSGDESNAELQTFGERAEFSRHANALNDVDAALARIADGTFGICADCGGEIDTDRLHASPAVRRCIACQTRFEKQHLSNVGPSL